jgi:hypothetical protein
LFYHEMQPMKNAGMKLRYKRVENFKHMSPEDDFIAGLLRFTQDKKFIAMQIKKAFPGRDAKTIMQEYESRHMEFLIPGRYVNKKIEMMENPGFLTTFKRSGKVYTVEISGINMSQYMEVIPIYLDSILRMNRDPKVLTSDMLALCKSKEVIEFEDEAPMMSIEEKPSKIFTEKEKETKLLVDEADEDEDGMDVVETKKEGDEDDEDEDSDFDYGLDAYAEDSDEDEDEGEESQLVCLKASNFLFKA